MKHHTCLLAFLPLQKDKQSFFCGPLSNVASAQNIMDGENDKENRQKTKKNIQIYLTIE